MEVSPQAYFRRVALGVVAVAVVYLPDGVFSIVSDTPWQMVILRMLSLISVSLLAVLPWAKEAEADVRRRLRWWSIPGVGASIIYLLSTDPVYLILGFCLLVGAAVDMWMTRAHIASETLRIRLTSGDGFRKPDHLPRSRRDGMGGEASRGRRAQVTDRI